MYLRLAALDLSAILGSFAIASSARFGLAWNSGVASIAGFLALIYMLTAFQSKAFTVETLQKPVESVRRATKSLALAVAIVVVALFAFKTSAEVSRLAIFAAAVLAFGSLAGVRWFFGMRWGVRHNWNFLNEVRLVDGPVIYPQGGELVLFANQLGISPETKNPVYLDRLGKLLRNADRVILECCPEKRVAWTHLLRGVGVDVEVSLPELGRMGALELRHHSGRSTVLVGTGPLGFRDRFLKRTFDLSLVIPALLLSAPIMLAIAVAIKLESKGPILFRQDRLGQGNRIFQVLKFRSMRTDLCDDVGAVSASRDDARITRVGKVIRRTSLDELPQLLNVVKGDMSIAGPRPHALASTAENELFWDIDESYLHRHAVKPGITGLAQVRGFRGATDKRSDVIDRVQADLEYVSSWSLWRDIVIIAQTVRVLVHPNAY